MNLFTTIAIAVGLAMDAFAVSVTSGVAIKRLKIHHALKIAFFFGLFQAIMPVIGWLAGLSLRMFIENIDHWIAFVLLSFIGGKMIYESRKIGKDKSIEDPLNIFVLLILSIATSIDALAVGITFAALNITIAEPVIIIGVITFILCLTGVYIGDRIGHLFESKMELAGGTILIFIGIKILVEHLS